MYQRARKLQEVSSKPVDVIPLMEDQLESYLLAINSLSLLESKNAWVVVQLPASNVKDFEVHADLMWPSHLANFMMIVP